MFEIEPQGRDGRPARRSRAARPRTSGTLVPTKVEFPSRKTLPHDVPSWVPDGSKYFITINSRARGMEMLTRYNRSQKIISSAVCYEDMNKWFLHALVVMPDHLHMIVSFPQVACICKTIKGWKGYLRRTRGIRWQRDYFEHRLRSEASVSEKTHYVLMNPVRKNLVRTWQDWPHKLVRGYYGR